MECPHPPQQVHSLLVLRDLSGLKSRSPIDKNLEQTANYSNEGELQGEFAELGEVVGALLSSGNEQPLAGVDKEHRCDDRQSDERRSNERRTRARPSALVHDFSFLGRGEGAAARCQPRAGVLRQTFDFEVSSNFWRPSMRAIAS